MTAVAGFNYGVDLLFTLLFFFRKDQGSLSRGRYLAGMACLLLTGVLYPTGTFAALSGTIQRFLIRADLTYGFAVLTLQIKPRAAAYATIYWCTLQLMLQSLFFAPSTYPLFTGQLIFWGNKWADLFTCLGVTLVIKAAVCLAVCVLTPLVQVSPVDGQDFFQLILMAVVAVWVKETVVPLTRETDTVGRMLSSYYLILQGVMITLLAAMERLRRSRRTNLAMAQQKLEAEALLRSIQNQQESAQQISALRHDLKNHMVALKLLLEQQRQAEAEQYLDRILQKIDTTRKPYATGNELVDGLLSVKLGDARAKQITVQVQLDMSKSDFLAGFDLCTLFGNVLDNALEACGNVAAEKRFLNISGGMRANTLVIRVENSCSERRFVLVDGLPQTRKPDSGRHGFGLRNVKAVLERYGGTLSVRTEQPGSFALTMVIPLP